MLGMIRFAAFAAAISVAANAYAAGAIAVDDEEGEHHEDVGYGVATGEHNREEAAGAAMRRCRQEGNKSCRVVVRFDKCGAYAVSSGHFGVGWGNSLRAAQTMSLKECGSNCRVAVSECE
jgi:hypothetical protein